MYSRTSEPGKLPAGLLAVLVHLAFVALLVFGVTWRTKAPAPVMVDLWSKLPSPSPVVNPEEPPPPQAAEETPPEPQPLPPPPKPKPKVEPAPAPKPDIALKEKEEKKKRLEAEKREQLEEVKRQQEADKQELERKKEDAHLKQEKLKEEQAKKLAAQREAQAKSQAERAANASGAMVASYMDRIRNKIERSTQVPDTVSGHPRAEFKLVLLPTGELLSVTLVKSSGNQAFDDAVQRGIERAQPFPLPPDPALFPSFRDINMPFTHEK